MGPISAAMNLCLLDSSFNPPLGQYSAFVIKVQFANSLTT
jgi:hypothetical protein